MRWLAAVVVVFGFGAVGPPAAAFSDPTSFEDAPDVGGGGERFFTGSLVDGLTCAVCHGGDARGEVAIAGLPEDGYAAGVIYDIDVRFAASSAQAATVELVTWQGITAGDLAPTDVELGDDERCEGAGLPASFLASAPERRQVVVMEGCGASRMRLRWTAPGPEAGPVWLSLAGVAGNGDEAHTGDELTEVAVFMPLAGSPYEAAAVESGPSCTVAGGVGAAPVPTVVLVLLVLFVIARRRPWLSSTAAVVLMVPVGSASADELAAAVQVLADSDHTTVVAPRVRALTEPETDTTVEVTYVADVWTSASIDIVTAATGPVTEHRDELRTSIGHSFDDLTVAASYRFSHEPDYIANGGTLSASLDLADASTTLSARVGGGHDFIGRAGDNELRESLSTVGGRIAVTQIVDPDTLVQLAWEGTWLRGFQSSPYRFVGIGGDGACDGSAHACIPETHPRRRVRQAWVLEAARSLGDSASFGAAYRFYVDDWGIASHTALTRLSLLPGEDTTLSLSHRFYLQGEANFYEPVYASVRSNPGYYTRDRELGAMTSHRGEVSWNQSIYIESTGQVVRTRLALGGVRSQFDDFRGLAAVTGVDVSASVGWEL